MALISTQYPFVQPWLTAKFFGLLAYILLGMMALKRGRTKAQRAAFFIAAMLAFAYIVSVALLRDPQGISRASRCPPPGRGGLTRGGDGSSAA